MIETSKTKRPVRDEIRNIVRDTETYRAGNIYPTAYAATSDLEGGLQARRVEGTRRKHPPTAPSSPPPIPLLPPHMEHQPDPGPKAKGATMPCHAMLCHALSCQAIQCNATTTSAGLKHSTACSSSLVLVRGAKGWTARSLRIDTAS